MIALRIKAVLRDGEILKMEPASKARIVTTARKNIDRIVSLNSLLKVMGLNAENRIELLQALKDSKLHIWLFQDSQQDLIFLSRNVNIPDYGFRGYKWQ
ncbi:MAG: hypothetical protein ACFFER_02495 [Candidatus Thorarchaeota archaeon]